MQVYSFSELQLVKHITSTFINEITSYIYVYIHIYIDYLIIKLAMFQINTFQESTYPNKNSVGDLSVF